MSFITAPIEDDTRQSSCASPGVQFTFTKVVPVASATARKVISAAGRARAYLEQLEHTTIHDITEQIFSERKG